MSKDLSEMSDDKLAIALTLIMKEFARRKMTLEIETAKYLIKILLDKMER